MRRPLQKRRVRRVMSVPTAHRLIQAPRVGGRGRAGDRAAERDDATHRIFRQAGEHPRIDATQALADQADLASARLAKQKAYPLHAGFDHVRVRPEVDALAPAMGRKATLDEELAQQPRRRVMRHQPREHQHRVPVTAPPHLQQGPQGEAGQRLVGRARLEHTQVKARRAYPLGGFEIVVLSVGGTVHVRTPLCGNWDVVHRFQRSARVGHGLAFCLAAERPDDANGVGLNGTQQRARRSRRVATTLFPIAQGGELDADQLGELGLTEPRRRPHRAHVHAIGRRGLRRSCRAAKQPAQSLEACLSPRPGGLQECFEDLVVQPWGDRVAAARLYANGIHTSMAYIHPLWGQMLIDQPGDAPFANDATTAGKTPRMP